MSAQDDQAAADGTDAPPPGTTDSDTPDQGPDDQQDPDATSLAPAEPELYEVVLPGGEVERLPLDELKRGYSRTRDYTQKTQAAAELKRQLEAEAGQTREQRAKYAELIDKVGQALERMNGPEPDWNKVRAEQPDEYPALWTDWQRRQKASADVQAEKDRLAAEERADLARRHQEFVAAEAQRLEAAIPEFRDPEKRRAGMTELATYARGMGFADQDIAAIADHRVVLLLRKAQAYDRLQQKRPDVTGKATPVKAGTVKPAAPGTPKSQPSVSPERKRAAERFAKSGSVDDMAELLKTIL
jgi:hypothetical protein